MQYQLAVVAYKNSLYIITAIKIHKSRIHHETSGHAVTVATVVRPTLT